MRSYRDFLAVRDSAKPSLDDRLRIFLDAYRSHKQELGRSVRVLDVACGRNAVLSEHIDGDDSYCGCDFNATVGAGVERYFAIDLNEESLAARLPGERFDVIFCGEILEHLFSPDALLDEIKTLMDRESILVLSTPNLAYYVNRLLLLVGISPLYVENASEAKLGRRFRALGQGNPTEGHIRAFTYGAVRDLLARKQLEIKNVHPTITWELPLDRLICRLSRSLAPNNVFVVTRDGAA